MAGEMKETRRRYPITLTVMVLMGVVSIAGLILTTMVLMEVVSIARRGGDREIELPDYVATLERPAESPSGDYLLAVVPDSDGQIDYLSFHILDQDDEVLYASPERFDRRHATYFLWDQEERVWVYSGDVGTYFWERNVEGDWVKHVYAQSDVPAPDFLKEVRPDWHQQ